MKKCLFLMLLVFLISNLYSQNKVVYISPLPGSNFINPQNNIIIGFEYPLAIDKEEISRSIILHGTSGGSYSGNIFITGDRKKIVIKPESSFKTGEKINVTLTGILAQINNTIAKGNSFSFGIYSKKIPWQSLNSMEFNLPPLQTLLSPPPAMNVTIFNNPSEGYIFSAPWFINTYLLISNREGQMYWNRERNSFNADFKKQPNGNLTYFSTALSRFVELNRSYTQVKTYRCGNGYVTDLHELIVLDNGHSLLMAYDPQEVDMSVIVPGGHSRASVVGLIIQEVDADTNVVFQWRSWDHMQITDAEHIDLTDSVIDYVHGNAIELDNDGNLMISSRHLDEITKINRTTGNIIWRLGGKNNQFTFINDTLKFCYQHDIRRVTNSNITLYDNGNYHLPQNSRALEYRLDETNMTATLVWQYYNTPAIFGAWGGNVQRLPNGNTLIGWGGATTAITEVTQAGTIAFQASFPSGYYTYRAYKFYWNGGPVAVNNNSGNIPSGFRLKQNFPNPFNPSTTIFFSVPLSGDAALKIFDITGKEILTLVDGNIEAGEYEVNFKASQLASGVYFCRLTAKGFSATQKMILSK